MAQDFGFPDGPDGDDEATARGIVQCLRMLAEEAAALGMARTLDALQTAITVCADEGDTEAGTAGQIRLRVAGNSRLH
jgi:hypothetical protein